MLMVPEWFVPGSSVCSLYFNNNYLNTEPGTDVVHTGHFLHDVGFLIADKVEELYNGQVTSEVEQEKSMQ